ncbi:MAG: histidine triad nucleotide-binding protein [Planctomycetota bacterium]
MADRTLFEKIIAREIPADLLHEDEHCVAFADINPQAPVHLLIVPRKPIPTLNDLAPDDAPVVGHLFTVARDLMAARGEKDFRTVFNCGEGAGQTVWHLHLHVLAGRTLGWPPG